MILFWLTTFSHALALSTLKHIFPQSVPASWDCTKKLDRFNIKNHFSVPCSWSQDLLVCRSFLLIGEWPEPLQDDKFVRTPWNLHSMYLDLTMKTLFYFSVHQRRKSWTIDPEERSGVALAHQDVNCLGHGQRARLSPFQGDVPQRPHVKSKIKHKL